MCRTEWATRIEVIRPLFTPRACLESSHILNLGEMGIFEGIRSIEPSLPGGVGDGRNRSLRNCVISMDG